MVDDPTIVYQGQASGVRKATTDMTDSPTTSLLVQNELNRMGIHPDPVGVVLEPVSGAAILAQRLLESAVAP